MGNEAETVFGTFNLTAEEAKDYDTVVKKFDNHFMPKRNIIYERAVFHQRSQEAGENIETFVRSLHMLAATCEFNEKKEEMIRDRLVIGIRSIETSRQLQAQEDLTLEVAVRKARQAESLGAQQSSLNRNAHNAETDEARTFRGASQSGFRPQHQQQQQQYNAQRYGNAGRGRARGRGRYRGNHNAPSRGSYNHASVNDRNHNAFPSRNHNATSQQLCGYCNKNHNGGRAQCPARDSSCRNCGKKGHYAVVCRSRNIKEVDQQHSNESTETFLLDSLYIMDSQSDTMLTDSVSVPSPPWMVDLEMNNTTTKFKVDSGADATVGTEEFYRGLNPRPHLEEAQVKLVGVGGQLNCLGQFETTVTWKKKKYKTTIYIVRGARNNLLARELAQDMGIITLNLNEANFTDVYGDLGLVDCHPVKIKIRPDATPYSVLTPRRIPLPLIEPVKNELERMEKSGVIQRITEPTDWCAPMVPVIKPNGKVRICVDLKKLNSCVNRERYILPQVEDILPQLAGAKHFSSLDAASGFWAIPLDPESSLLTTFITPYGRYCFRRLPFGISSAPEIFQRIMNDILQEEILKGGVTIYMDDILVYGRTLQEHDERLNRVMMTIKKSGLKLNRTKCKIRVTHLDFLGHTISGEGVQPSTEKVRAIRDLPEPEDVPSLRQCLGLINYLGKYCPQLADTLRPLNDLLHTDRSWTWDSSHQKAFDKAKHLITRAPVLAYFDLRKPTTVSADASSYGLGAALLQTQADGSLKPVAFASRTLTDSERKYAQIEKECLASVWACEKFSQFLTGLQSFELYTDHKPLVPLMMSRDLDQTPARCQRLLIRLMRFRPEVTYVPGKNLVIADALSRCPTPHTTDEMQKTLEEDITLSVEMIRRKACTSARLEDIRHATDKDDLLQSVMDYTEAGWPNYIKDVPQNLRKFYEIRAHLSTTDRLLLYNDRIYIPQALQQYVLTKVHQGHPGITKSRERAKAGVFWIGISQDIEDFVNNCEHCQEQQRTQTKLPLVSTPLPDRPWQHIAADIAELKGKQYLITVDYFSRYIEINHLSTITSNSVITALKTLFTRWGIPTSLKTDNGTQFTSYEFQEFSKEWDFEHTTSSPHHPQSNGEAERAVATAKSIMKQSDKDMGLLTYRSTPIPSLGYSPAQLIMGRNIRTTLPTLDSHLVPRWPPLKELQRKDSQTKRRNEANAEGRDLQPLSPGQLVRMKLDHEKEWGEPVTVLHAIGPRSYVLQTPSGTIRRHRRHLRVANRPVQLFDDTPNPTDQRREDRMVHRPLPLNATVRRSQRNRRTPSRLDL